MIRQDLTRIYKPLKTDVLGVVKLIRDRKPSKRLGPAGVRKEALRIDVEQAAACLTIICNKSLEQESVANSKFDAYIQIRLY